VTGLHTNELVGTVYTMIKYLFNSPYRDILCDDTFCPHIDSIISIYRYRTATYMYVVIVAHGVNDAINEVAESVLKAIASNKNTLCRYVDRYTGWPYDARIRVRVPPYCNLI
jgi:hypothetical protein